MIEYYDIYSEKNIELKLQNTKNIFSFWEPRNGIPGYISLCIKTWKKYLPQYRINILDYKSAKKCIGANLFNKIVDKEMPLLVQSDAIRVSLLKKYGGVWMDADTIITNGNFIKNLEKYELVMIGANKTQHIGFIMASLNSVIIDKWLNEIINKVSIYRDIVSQSKIRRHIVKWDYLGNEIVDRVLNSFKGNKFFRLDKYKINAFPEIKFFENTSLGADEKYKLLYFQKREPKIILNNSKGIILLHNSWTPLEYKKLTEKEFLKKDILLSRLLSQILYICL